MYDLQDSNTNSLNSTYKNVIIFLLYTGRYTGKFTHAVFLYQLKENIAFSILKKILVLFCFKSIYKIETSVN